ncbi:Reverse transcriptase zinc-binding domain [Macleaya cordata]|uniref:Reverse transcriptase zinc-binding domain n=1 Tax=Macleaya cordata TaxID=56857 RepID=A0A200QN82_MACCD|nr:Reverse transcriptase zinc-binding domain [Macleaya cordata]
MNSSLLAKWCWRFGSEKDQLWCQVIILKYGNTPSSWYPEQVKTPHGTSLWKSIAAHAHIIFKNSAFKVGVGTNISFWFDVWCGHARLKDSFPSLYKLSRQKKESLATLISLQPSPPSWNLIFSERIEDTGIGHLADLLFSIGAVPPLLSTVDDSRSWKLSPNGTFSVKSTYESLSHPAVSDFPVKFVWNRHIPPKICFFVWSACLNKIPTIDTLRKRGMCIPNCCYLCGRNNESASHLLLHCNYSKEVWNLILPHSGWSWVFPESVEGVAHSWSFLAPHGTGRKIWPFIPFAIMWSTWLERNNRAFNNIAKSPLKVSIDVKALLLSWGWAAFIDFRFRLDHLIFSWDSLFLP